MNLSSIILDLERIARAMEAKQIRNEEVVTELQRNGEQLFLLAGRIRDRK